MNDELAKVLREAVEAAEKVPPATTLYMNHDGKAVELYVDNQASDYSDWIVGEGSDIGLMREMDTNRVVGCRLPLYHEKLIVGGDAEIDALKEAAPLYRDLHRAAKKLHKSVWNKGVHEALAALDAAGVTTEEVSGE